jgi:hypothetical protein
MPIKHYVSGIIEVRNANSNSFEPKVYAEILANKRSIFYKGSTYKSFRAFVEQEKGLYRGCTMRHIHQSEEFLPGVPSITSPIKSSCHPESQQGSPSKTSTKGLIYRPGSFTPPPIAPIASKGQHHAHLSDKEMHLGAACVDALLLLASLTSTINTSSFPNPPTYAAAQQQWSSKLSTVGCGNTTPSRGLGFDLPNAKRLKCFHTLPILNHGIGEHAIAHCPNLQQFATMESHPTTVHSFHPHLAPYRSTILQR